MQALNCAESATTVTPQAAASGHTAQGGAQPMVAAQAPEASIASAAIRARLKRSASNPRATQPMAPAPTTSAVSAPAGQDAPCAAPREARNSPTQAQTAYSSHMWPR